VSDISLYIFVAVGIVFNAVTTGDHFCKINIWDLSVVTFFPHFNVVLFYVITFSVLLAMMAGLQSVLY